MIDKTIVNNFQMFEIHFEQTDLMDPLLEEISVRSFTFFIITLRKVING